MLYVYIFILFWVIQSQISIRHSVQKDKTTLGYDILDIGSIGSTAHANNL